MTIRKSSCLKSKLMGAQGSGTGDGLSAIMTQFFIDGYTGTQPASADDAPTGTKLITWSINNQGDGSASYGGTWAAPTNVGVLARTSSETLTGTALADGSLGWVRIRKYNDGFALDATKVKARIDLSVASYNADINVSTTTMVTGTVYPFGPLQFTAS